MKYLDKFWDNIFAFLKDGSLPIDNNLAERAIRPLTTQRNAMLHFGSDEGVEMAATYHSIISTVKMQGRSAWEYLGKFFTKIFNGCRDFFSMRPDKIAENGGYPPTQNGDIRSLFWLFSLMALQN